MADYRRHVVSPKVAVVLEIGRLRHGWSYRQAAKAAGCTSTFLWLLEGCRRAPSTEMAADIAAAYRLDSDDTIALVSESVSTRHTARYSAPGSHSPVITG